MATFKIRDLMVALRPGLPTPQRPAPLEDCDPVLGSLCPNFAPLDSGGGGCGLGSCFGTCGATVGCGFTCGITKGCGGCTAGGACTNACTDTCGASCGCTYCSNVTCGYCSGQATDCSARSYQPPIARMAAGDLATLKSQLRLAMQQVSQREMELAAAEESAAAVPQTLAQVDALEQKLTGALDELRARRAAIQAAGGTAGPGGTDDKK